MPKGGWRGGGRPQGSTSRKPVRDVVKQNRWTADEWAEVERKAEAAGITPSEYIRAATLSRKDL
jgi:hypothetical protein